MVRGILVPQPDIEPKLSKMKAWNLNHLPAGHFLIFVNEVCPRSRFLFA